MVKRLCKKSGLTNTRLDSHRKTSELKTSERRSGNQKANEEFEKFQVAAREKRGAAEVEILNQNGVIELWGNKVGCTICNHGFEDSISNVKKHVDDHRSNRGVKIYVKNKGGARVTEYAYQDHHHKRAYGGGDTKIFKCIFPRGAVEGTTIKCSACRWKWDFGKTSEQPLERHKSRALQSWRNHIRTCKDWKPDEELVW